MKHTQKMCLEVFLIHGEPVFLMWMILPTYTFANFTIYQYTHGLAKTLRMNGFKKEYGYRRNTILFWCSCSEIDWKLLYLIYMIFINNVTDFIVTIIDLHGAHVQDV